MLKEEVDSLLNKIEEELFNFMSYIKDVEHEYNRSLPGVENISEDGSSPGIKRDRGQPSKDYSAIVDAFNIVKNVLTRITNMIDVFSSLPTDDEKNMKSNKSYLFKFYYVQYVYQITACLMKMVEQHLSNFSENLDQLASQVSAEKEDDNLFSYFQREIPEHLGLQKTQKVPEHHRFLKNLQATVADDEDSNLHPEDKDDSCWLTSYAEAESEDLLESSSEEDSDASSDDEYADRYPRYTDRSNELEDLLNDLGNAFMNLSEAIESLMLILNKSRSKVPKQKKFSSDFKNVEPDQTSFETNGCEYCCGSNCKKCCIACRGSHRKQKLETYKEQRLSWAEHMLPVISKEPFWMKTKSAAEGNSSKKAPHFNKMKSSKQGHKMSSQTGERSDIHVKRNAETHHARSKKDHGTKSSGFQSYDFDEQATTSEGGRNPSKTQENANWFDQVKQTETIKPGRATKQLSSGDLKSMRKKTLSKKKRMRNIKIIRSRSGEEIEYEGKRIPSELRYLLKHELQKKEDQKLKKVGTSRNRPALTEEDNLSRRKQHGKAFTEDIEKPAFLGDAQKKLFCNRHAERREDDDSCLLPGAELLINKNLIEDYVYPHAILLEIHTFSNKLIDKFKEAFSDSSETEKTEYERIIDVMLDSLIESLCVFYETDDVNEEENETERSDKATKKDERDHKTTERDHKTTKTNENLTEKSDKIKLNDQNIEMSDDLFGSKSKKTMNDYASKIIGIASGMIQDGNYLDGSLLSNEIRKALRGKEDVTRACKGCWNMVKHSERDSKKGRKPDDQEEGKSLGREMLEGICFHCWNARERGALTIHQCHERLPPATLEVRHMDECGKICVCFLQWDRSVENEDWRWLKTPFHQSTKVEMQQEAAEDQDPYLSVIYGPRGNMVKESLAETNLSIVADQPRVFRSDIRKVTTENTGEERSLSASYLLTRKSKTSTAETFEKVKPVLNLSERKIINKLGRFFDDIQYVGYGKGPPLVLKLRRSMLLNDSLNVLMAPSKIKLNYYRSLRVLLTSDDWALESSASSTNFIKEDQSDELFSFLANKLFSASDLRLFVYPSEESHYLYLNPEPIAHAQWLTFAGVVLGLALLHQKQMEISLAPCLIKCVLGRSLGLSDLIEIDPVLHQNLMWLKENDVGRRKMKIYFSIKDTVGGRVYENELIANGKNIAVTEKNKYRYIDLAVRWKLAQRCLSQLKDFSSGFALVVQPSFYALFSEKELLSLLRNPPDTEILLSESGSTKSRSEVSRRGTL